MSSPLDYEAEVCLSPKGKWYWRVINREGKTVNASGEAPTNSYGKLQGWEPFHWYAKYQARDKLKRLRRYLSSKENKERIR